MNALTTIEKKLTPTMIVEELTPEEAVAARKRRNQFDRNSAWLEALASDVYPSHPGKCICSAGQELFVADSATEAVAKARAAHPEDDGWFTCYIPKEKAARIYGL